MKTPAKKRTAAELAAAVLWCALTLGTDRLFFRYDWRTPAFFVYKALFLVLAFGLVHGAVTLVQKLRAGDKFARRWVAWTLPYLAVSTSLPFRVSRGREAHSPSISHRNSPTYRPSHPPPRQ